MPSTEYQGGPLAFEIIDQALPWHAPHQTILFHHGLGSCAAIWSGWLPTLVDRYRLIRFDMRGHGASTVPADFRWSLEGMVEDALAVAQATDSQRFHLVGESIGGTIALALAAAHSDRVLSLTVSNGAHVGGSIRNVESWKDIIERGGMPAWSAHMMHMRFREGALSPSMWRWYETQQASCDAGAVLDALAVLTGADLGPVLPSVSMPVLLLHPDSSPFIPVSMMAELKERLPNARLEVFPDAMHGLPFSHAAQCAGALRRFLMAAGCGFGHG